jgi:hypothetical protein
MRTGLITGLAVLLLCIALACPAANYYHLRDYVTNTYGTAISGASVQVYNPNTTTNPSAYTDLAGGTGVSWPLTTDSNGMFGCYLAQGTYDIYIVHSGHRIDTTWDNYMVGSGSDTVSYSSLEVTGTLDVTGTVSANAVDAEDWIDAGGGITSATVTTSGAATLGGGVVTGGTVEIGGGLYVIDQTKLAYDEVGNDWSINITPNWIIIRPLLEVHDDTYVYGDVRVYGKDAISGRLTAQLVEGDTLKPRTGRGLSFRSAGGKNDGIFRTQFLELAPVDISLSLPDTSGYNVGTLMYCSDDSFRYLAGAGIAKEWRTLGYAGYVAGEDNPELYLPTTTLNYAYADSHVQKFGVGNSGEGILPWTSSFISDWIAEGTGLDQHDGAADSGYVGAGYDSVTVQLMWAQIAQGASLHDTVDVTTDYGNGQVVINATGEPFTGQDYVVEPNHPRLYFNENTIAEQRAKCKSAELTFYTGFIDYINSSVVGDDYPLAYVYDQGKQLGRLAFAYAMEQDTLYLHEAVLCANSLFADYTTTWDDDGDARAGMAQFYDWCYEGFGSTRKALYGDSLAQAFKRLHAAANYMTNPAHSQIVVMAPIMPLALAVAGDGFEDAIATAALDSIYAHTFGSYHMGAILDSIGNDGGGFEGEHYSEDGGTAASVSTLFWLWDYGTDKDPWTSTNMTGMGDYLLYDTSARTEVVYYDVSGPSQYQLYAFGSSKQSDTNAHAGTRDSRILLVSRLANAYQDSSLIWMSDQYDSLTGGVNTPARWKHIIVRDTLMTQSRPSTVAAGYATAKQSDVGTVFMRENWDLSSGSTDVWATYRHEQYPFGHAHADAGHFIVGRGHDLLFIDSGEYYNSLSDHHRNYFKQTVAHNAITIKDFSETFLSYRNSGGQDLQGLAYSGEHPLTLGAYTDSMAGADGRGSITDYAHRADTLTYIRSDLTSAYSSAKVDTVRREFVWMEPDDVFLVFDYADVDSFGFLQKSLFHTINNPTLNGDDTWTVVHGTSEATLTFYGNATISKVGGSGSEFMADGTNWPLPSTTDYHSDNGAWRIEAAPSRGSESRWLLTIIETSVVGGADYGTVSTVTVGDYIGAVVNGDTLLFHAWGGEYQYRAQ